MGVLYFCCVLEWEKFEKTLVNADGGRLSKSNASISCLSKSETGNPPPRTPPAEGFSHSSFRNNKLYIKRPWSKFELELSIARVSFWDYSIIAALVENLLECLPVATSARARRSVWHSLRITSTAFIPGRTADFFSTGGWRVERTPPCEKYKISMN